MPEKRNRWVCAVVLGVSLLGIGLRIRTLAGLTPQDLCGADFPIFYAGGKLAGSPDLYSAAAVRTIAIKEAGCIQPPALFVRLPYFAALMIPWSRLPYWTAFWMWRAALVAAAAIFILLWPAPREWSVLALAWSLPFAFGLTVGQDSGFLLLWLAAALTLLKRDQPFLAGLALSMCLAKFHLFLLVPLLLPGRRRMAWGGILGGMVLLGACFAVQGPHWFQQFLGAIGDKTINPQPSEFFNLWGIAHGNTTIEILLAVPVVIATVYATRRADLMLSLSAVLVGGLLIGHHQTTSDMVVLIPVALTLAFHPQAKYSKVMAIYLVSPLAYALTTAPVAWELPRLVLLALIGALAWEVRPAATALESNGAAAERLTGDGSVRQTSLA